MKKTLVALAALSAVSVFAQSSVTIFGTADAGLAIGNGATANFIGLRNSGLASAALGFRGVEDLGGGMKASFHLEGSALTDAGTGAASNTNNQATGATAGQAGNQGFTFGRRASVCGVQRARKTTSWPLETSVASNPKRTNSFPAVALF